MAGSYASAETIAHIVNERFVQGVPYHRLEKEWNSLKLPVSRRTMSDWIMLASKNYMEPVWEQMKSELLKQEYIHCDETPIQVLREEGRKNTSKSW
ncbi:IS66 family transposase, partial [Dubosiella newyorkensis]|uniref:IS66 family transposase n=1 Tax=Dubosiella newyorkensis TaxID=1862672 RepID=UPI003CCFEF75